MSQEGTAARPLTLKELQGADSRRRILEAASSLMAERGFAGTSISAVSRRSGLPASSLYWHFGSKEGLLAAVVEDGAERWFARLPRPEELPEPPAERVEALLRAIAASLEPGPEFLRLLLLIALERRKIDPISLEMIRRVRERALERGRGIIALLLAPLGADAAARVAEDFAMFGLAVADGIFIQNQIDPDGTDVRRLVEVLRRALAALARELVEEASGPRRASKRGGKR